MKQCVVFATPTLAHQVSVDFLNAMLDVRLLLAQRGIPHAFRQVGGDCFVAKARNKLATQFVQEHPQATDLFFVDDDVGFPAEKVIEFLGRPEDVVAGVYPKKSDATDFPVTLLGSADGLIEHNGLIQAHAVPTGFLRIKRRVVEQLAGRSTKFKDRGANGEIEEFYNIFEAGRGPDGFWWGEDYTFCRKWSDLGGEIWVDPSIPFKHRGSKTWKAALSDHMDTFRANAITAVKEAA